MDENAKIVAPAGDAWESAMPITVGFDVTEPGSYKVQVSKDETGLIVVEVTRDADLIDA
jgi:hypothetical protein